MLNFSLVNCMEFSKYAMGKMVTLWWLARLNTFHMHCLGRILEISWKDRIPNKEVLAQAETTSIFAMLTKSRLRKQAASHQAGSKQWQQTAVCGNMLSSQQSRHQSRGESSSGRRRKNADDREQRQHRRTTTSSPAAPATGPVVRESGSTATAGAAAQQQTRPRRNLHCLPRQTDANNYGDSLVTRAHGCNRKLQLYFCTSNSFPKGLVHRGITSCSSPTVFTVKSTYLRCFSGCILGSCDN